MKTMGELTPGEKISNNRPTVAGLVIGLVVSGGTLLLEVVPTTPFNDFLEYAILVVAGLAGAAVGKLTQGRTWSERSHQEAVAEALSRDPSLVPDEVYRRLGFPGGRDEVLRHIGLRPEDEV